MGINKMMQDDAGLIEVMTKIVIIDSLRDMNLVYLSPRLKVLLGGKITLTFTNSDTAVVIGELFSISLNFYKQLVLSK